MDERPLPPPGRWSLAWAYAATDARILWRMKTPLVFMFLVPALLASVVGPAVSGLSGPAAQGRSMLGFAVMFSFMTTNYSGLALFREFVGETWVRQAVFRPSKGSFLLGKLMPVFAIGLLQLVVLGACSLAFLHLPLHGSLAQLFAVAVSTVMLGSFTGIVLYNLTATTSTFQSVTYLLLLGLAGIGGAVVAPEHLPAASRAVAPLTPHFWVMKAVSESTVGGGSWRPVWEAIARLAAGAVVLGLVAFATLDYTKEKSVAA